MPPPEYRTEAEKSCVACHVLPQAYRETFCCDWPRSYRPVDRPMTGLTPESVRSPAPRHAKLRDAFGA